MRKKLLPIIIFFLVMGIGLIGCGGKSESSEENVNNTEATEETDTKIEPIKCENHGAEITIPGDYSLTSDSDESSLIYSNHDGNKGIAFSYSPYIKDDEGTTISWDSIIENLSSNLKIETYEEMLFDGLPGIKLYVNYNTGYTGEMAVIIDQDNNSSYTIQMLESGNFDEEGTFDKIIDSFNIVKKADSPDYDYEASDDTNIAMTDMELLTFEGHPKYLDDYYLAKQKWGNDERVSLKEGDGTTSYAEGIIIMAESRGTAYKGYEKYKNNKLEYIEILFDSCKDEASTLSLDDALSIIKSYLPLEIMNEKYHIEDSVYWPNEENGTETFFISYNIDEDISEDEREAEGLTVSICIQIWVDPDGSVQGARIDQYGVINYLGEEYTEWGYDFLENQGE